MPGLVPGIHVFAATGEQDVDGRDKPGHDSEEPRGLGEQRLCRPLIESPTVAAG